MQKRSVSPEDLRRRNNANRCVFHFFCPEKDFKFFFTAEQGMAGAVAGGEDVFKKVFRQVHLVTQFKKCWRIRNYYLNKATRAWAIAGDIEIEPVLFRGNVDAFKTAALSVPREPLIPRIRIGAMVWPHDIDPTSFPPCDEGPSIARAWRHKFNWLVSFMDNTAHAQHIRSLSVRMSLRHDLSPLYTPGIDVNALGLGWKYDPAKIFLAAFAKCTAIEHLSIEQSDYVAQTAAQNAEQNTVQVKLLELVQKMEGLISVEWNGNMVVYHQFSNKSDNRVGSIFDYIGNPVRELYFKDGPEPRMETWQDPAGISLDFCNLMRNNISGPSTNAGLYWFTTLETLYMPRSFWSLTVPKFNTFMDPLNSGSISRIGFADPFTLKEGPSETQVAGRFVGIRRRVKNPPPYLALYHLITHVSRDITIDIRVKKSTVASTERAVRIAWLESIPSTHAQFFQTQRVDSAEFATFSFSKLRGTQNFTVQVLV